MLLFGYDVFHINNKYPTFPGLIFVEGIQDVYDAAWGGSFALIDNKINYIYQIINFIHFTKKTLSTFLYRFFGF